MVKSSRTVLQVMIKQAAIDKYSIEEYYYGGYSNIENSGPKRTKKFK